MPIATGIFVEGSFGGVASQAVIDLPGDQLRVLAESFSQRADYFARVLPVDIAVQGVGAARSLVPLCPSLIQGQDLWVRLGKPKRRGGCGCTQDNFDAGAAKQIH